MQSDKTINVYVYVKGHRKPDYQLVFSNEEKVTQFIDYINSDVDFVRLGDEVIRRKVIDKVVIDDAR